MRSGLRNAEPGEPPGGTESDRSSNVAGTCSVTMSADAAPAASRPANDNRVRVGASASTGSVSQLCAGMADISGASDDGSTTSLLSG